MRKAIFICGFSNWGKSTIFRSLFDKKKFSSNRLFQIKSIKEDFIVQEGSNDDAPVDKWLKLVGNKIDKQKDKDTHLICALCLTKDGFKSKGQSGNDFVQILSDNIFRSFDEIFLFLIIYKWDHNAKLVPEEISKKVKNINKIKIIIIDEDKNEEDDEKRLTAKINQITRELQNIFK